MATETEELKKTVNEQAELIRQLKQAILRLERRIVLLDKRVTTVSEAGRRTASELVKVASLLKKRDDY